MAALTANEGTPATNTGTFADAQGRGTVTLTASVGTVTQNTTNGTWSWSYTPPDGPASSTVTITATDTGGLIASTSFTLNVLNVAPTITAFSVPSNGAEGSPVNLSATATDPAGANDTLTYTWTITRPDGSTFATLTGAQASFTPPDNGNYGVSLTVSDGDGGTASRSAAPVGLVSWWRGQGNANDALGAQQRHSGGRRDLCRGRGRESLQLQRHRRSVGPELAEPEPHNRGHAGEPGSSPPPWPSTTTSGRSSPRAAARRGTTASLSSRMAPSTCRILMPPEPMSSLRPHQTSSPSTNSATSRQSSTPPRA